LENPDKYVPYFLRKTKKKETIFQGLMVAFVFVFDVYRGK
jgi:hypothetical protein